MRPLAALLIALAAPAAGQDAAPPEALVLVRAARVVDVEAGVLKRDQAILIRGERVVRVAPAGDLTVPEGAAVIDLGDATVLPGLIDAHVHLTGDSETHGYASLGVSIPREALFGARNARRTLLAGFTTARNVGARAFTDVALRDAIAAGDLEGPRLVVSGPALGITGGHCDSNLLPPHYDARAEAVADGPWAVREQVRRNVKYGADLIKFCATGGVMSKGTRIAAQQYTLEEMQALVDEAHALGLRVAAHAHSAPGIKAAIRAGVDSIEHASQLDAEAIALAREKGTALVMDVYVSDFILEEGEAAGILPESLAKEREVGQAQRESFGRAVGAGIRVVFGSDAAIYPHGRNARQFAYMVRHGMTPMQAIQAATVHAAELLGLSEDVGALAPGRYADLIAVEGDPLERIQVLESVPFVMKGGAVVKDERG